MRKVNWSVLIKHALKGDIKKFFNRIRFIIYGLILLKSPYQSFRNNFAVRESKKNNIYKFRYLFY